MLMCMMSYCSYSMKTVSQILENKNKHKHTLLVPSEQSEAGYTEEVRRENWGLSRPCYIHF